MSRQQTVLPALVAPAPAAEAEAARPAAPRPGEGLYDHLHRLFFETDNQRHRDGRIHAGVDRFGRIYALTVSPHARTFWNNVEPGVVPLIRALRAKGYLTYSSCEGHGRFSRRYVGVAFGDLASRDAFVAACRRWWLPWLRVDTAGSRSNLRLVFHETHVEVQRNPEARHGQGSNEAEPAADEALGFNLLFRRACPRWYFADLVILDWTPARPRGKRWALMAAKSWVWDWLTWPVVWRLRGKSFPAYPL